MNLIKILTLPILLSIFFCLACNSNAPQTNHLIQNWHLNDSKETAGEWLGDAQTIDFNMQFNRDNSLLMSRTKGSRKDVITGTWQQTNQELHFQFKERKTYVLVRDLNNHDQVAEENLQQEQKINIILNFVIEQNTQYLLKLKNDTLAYTFVPKI